MRHDVVHDNQFEQEFLYAISKSPTTTQSEDISFLHENAKYNKWMKDLLLGYRFMKEQKLEDARVHFATVIKKDRENTMALRSLGFIEYQLCDYKISKQYLEEYRRNNTQHVFYQHYIDTKVLRKLMGACFYVWSFGSWLRYLFLLIKWLHTNRNLRKQYIIL